MRKTGLPISLLQETSKVRIECIMYLVLVCLSLQGMQIFEILLGGGAGRMGGMQSQIVLLISLSYYYYSQAHELLQCVWLISSFLKNAPLFTTEPH